MPRFRLFAVMFLKPAIQFPFRCRFHRRATLRALGGEQTKFLHSRHRFSTAIQLPNSFESWFRFVSRPNPYASSE